MESTLREPIRSNPRSNITQTSAAAWPAFLPPLPSSSYPRVGISISFWPGAVLRGFLAGLAAFAGAASFAEIRQPGVAG
ncbi:hypothetical protein H8A99_28940 [Bradyrhizobium sp. Arg68]|uniref:hypothetical protein n=1 Tax=Bradyrhizobium ivorense TaxID=2511166 RepID=UPI001E318ED5|nr:hypothetical protein [Bradyrhizobium ivorense]MCC8940374.1 hypothetical protein [Bradyrhizobium ivorense]